MDLEVNSFITLSFDFFLETLGQDTKHQTDLLFLYCSSISVRYFNL